MSLFKSSKKERLSWHDRTLAKRMARPQRHRLLQGFPMSKAMRPMETEESWLTPEIKSATQHRPLILGLMPHTFCNPKVKGCGFCTFPHESYSRQAAAQTTESVRREIDQFVTKHPEVAARHVEAVYIGGGTANLSSPSDLEMLHRSVSEHFDLREAEYTLEGAPVYFTTRDAEHLEQLAKLPVRQGRISMGVQTFDPSWLAKMGREAIGSPEHVEHAVQRARALGLTTSVDLLYNLPGQTVAQMVEDVRSADALGVDQICVYNLVLFEGIGTEWSQDDAMLEGLRSMEAACEAWIEVKRELEALGFEQSTLTNFERGAVSQSAKRFMYERCSFSPQWYDALGFGPGALSTFSASTTSGIKAMNASSSEAYRARVDLTGSGGEQGFSYEEEDMKLLHLTRGFALGRVSRTQYQHRFGSDMVEDFAQDFEACDKAGLTKALPNEVVLTPRGQFFADSVVGMLAKQRIKVLYPEYRDMNNAVAHMG